MTHSFKYAISAFTAALLFSGCGSDSENETHKALSTTLIHINDHHSHLAQETKDLKFNGVKTRTTIGGFPRVVSKIKSLQESRENAITLHAGDIIQGTLYYTLFKGEADAQMMNQITWDAVTLGNHEFDDGDEGLKSLLDQMDAPIVSANVVPQAGNMLEGYWEPYRIIERDGEKIGIIGIDITQKTKVSSSPSDTVDFLDEIETTQKYVDELKAKDVNKIILVSHFGMDNDLDLATKVEGVDVIIDGDSHSLMGDFSMVGLTSHYSDYPKMVTSKSGEPVCVTSAWQYSYVVGDLQVDFSKEGLVEKCEGTPVLLLGESYLQKNAEGTRVEVEGDIRDGIMNVIDANAQLEIVTPDAATATKLQTYSDQVDTLKQEVVGSSSEVLGHSRIPGDIYDGANYLTLGSDIAPLVAKSFYLKSNRADACIQNAGGVRVAVDEGNITIENAYTLLPFSNTLFEIEMKGSEIKQVMEDALTNYLDNGGSTGSFPYAYGLRYDVDVTMAADNRISNLEILDRTTQSWSTISDTTMYVIVTNDYISAGRDGYTTFATVQTERGEGVNTYYDYAMSFVDMVEGLDAEGKSLEKLPSSEHPIKSFKGMELSGWELPYTVLRDDLDNGAKPGNTFEIRNGGYGSDAVIHPTNSKQFYALTDRGPNASYTGADGKGKKFPTPDYTPRIGLFEFQDDKSVTKVSEILLKRPDGTPITGLPNSSALGGTGETPYDAEGNTIKETNGSIKLDDYGLDGEGIAALSDGTFWISDEYGPHMVHFDAEGKEIGRINAFAADARNTHTLPAEYAYRRANRGMEGLTITPDEKTLVGIMQSTMYLPSSAVKALDITRIVAIDVATGEAKQYLYKQEKAQNSNSGIVALSNDTFLLIERDGSFLKGGPKNPDSEAQKHVYKITLSSGTEIENVALTASMVQDADLGLTIDGKTLEEVVLNGGWDALAAKGITPITKSLVVDMVDAVEYPHDKMEGLIVFDNETLGVLNDDDFATWATGGVLEQKYIGAGMSNADGNRLYIVDGLNLSAD